MTASCGRPHPLALLPVALFAVWALGVLLALGGCGSQPSATDKACSARDDLTTSVRTVVDDLRAGNLGKARDQLADVRSKASALGSAVADLGSAERDRLQPQVQQLQDDLKAVGGASSLSGLSSAFAAVSSSASDLATVLGEDLSCS